MSIIDWVLIVMMAGTVYVQILLMSRFKTMQKNYHGLYHEHADLAWKFKIHEEDTHTKIEQTKKMMRYGSGEQ